MDVRLWKPAAWVAVALGGALVAPAVRPLDPTLNPIGEALAFGCLVGGAAFLVLARRRISSSWFRGVPHRRLLARGAVLTAKSAEGERSGAHSRSACSFGRSEHRGLVVSSGSSPQPTSGASGGGRGAPRHRLFFGLTYLATGRLAAAVAAHGTYNVLVGVTPVAAPDMSLPDTGRGSAGLVASEAPSAVLCPMREPPVTQAPPLALLEGVTKSFGSVRALDGIDLEVTSAARSSPCSARTGPGSRLPSQ